MSKIMNEKNEWDQNADTIEEQIQRMIREEIMDSFKYLKIGKAPGPIEVYAEMILVSGYVWIRVLMELFQMGQESQKTGPVIPIFTGKGDIMNSDE